MRIAGRIVRDRETMDTLTHGLAGALLARALPPPRDEGLAAALRRREAWTGFAAAMAPDLDALLSPFSADFYITHHRGLSHSFVLLPLWALLIGVVATWGVARGGSGPPGRRAAFLRLSLVSAVGLASHVLLDWITSWGTMFFSPLSWERYSLDWVFIVDLVLSGLLALGLLATRAAGRRQGPRSARLAATAGALAATAYIAFCGVQHGRALAVGETIALPGAVARAAIPQPLSPFRWLLLSDDGARVRSAFVDLSRTASPPRVAGGVDSLSRLTSGEAGPLAALRHLDGLFASPDALRPQDVAKADGPLSMRALVEGEKGVFGRFARFPAARSEPRPDGGVTVELRDLRFGHLAGAIDPFTYVVRFGASGELLGEGFPSPRWGAHGERAR